MELKGDDKIRPTITLQWLCSSGFFFKCNSWSSSLHWLQSLDGLFLARDVVFTLEEKK